MYRSVIPQRTGIEQLPKAKQSLEKADKHPTFGLNYSASSTLKITSRKNSYFIGDMVGIDIAIRNEANEAVFFYLPPLHNLVTSLKVVDESGNKVLLSTYIVLDSSRSMSSYALVAPHKYKTFHPVVLAGCSPEPFIQINALFDHNVDTFAKDMFVNWGDACLAVNKAGIYTINLELKNEYVVIPANDKTASNKTGVGTISSNTLKLNISAPPPNQ
jgi:hypothetical protein